MTSAEADVRQLRVLIANERRERLELLAQVVIGLGHDVIAREIYVKEVGSTTARERPDVAIVGLGLSSQHALELIGEIVREASGPVIALLHANDPAYIHGAAKRGVFVIDRGKSCPSGATSARSCPPARTTTYPTICLDSQFRRETRDGIRIVWSSDRSGPAGSFA